MVEVTAQGSLAELIMNKFLEQAQSLEIARSTQVFFCWIQGFFFFFFAGFKLTHCFVIDIGVVCASPKWNHLGKGGNGSGLGGDPWLVFLMMHVRSYVITKYNI